jgi:ubiquinone/menaquinone biosynthesis C-methylase UbiE
VTGTGYGWRLDERRFAGRENLDPEHVAAYDDKEDGRGPAEVALLVGLGLGPTSTLIDLGAGTGQLTLAAASFAGRVVAVDVSPVMLQRLQTKVTEAGLANVEVVEAGFLTYEHTGPPADVVYCRWALHHLPDLWKAVALHRMRRCLSGGGLLRLSDIVFSCGPDEVEQRLEAWCASVPEVAPAGQWIRADLEEHVRDEHSTFTWLLEPMIERAGFHIEASSYSGGGIYAEYLARAV